MRNAMRFLLVGAVAATLAVPASAQVLVQGRVAEPGCTGVVSDISAAPFGGELYVFKVASAASSSTDVLFDLSNKGGMAAGGALVGGSGPWSVPPNWRNPQAPDDVHYAIITLGPDATAANRVYLDSGTISPFNYGFAMYQTVGDSLPTGTDAGIGLTLPGATQYTVDLGAGSADFPQAGSGGITVAFSPLAEVNRTSLSGPCTIAGDTDAAGDPDGIRGLVIGYNVYRLPDAGGAPTAADFQNGGFQYFIDLTTFDPQTSDSTPGGPGMDAPTDMGLGDLAGMQNPDGDMYTGDEVLIFQDTDSNTIAGSGTVVPRTTGSAPVLGTTYWYAFQPVVAGMVSQYASVGFANGSGAFPGDHTMDLDMNGMADAVDLDLDGTPEFISPQAEAGLPGLGLTWNSQIVISNPQQGSFANLPAGGQISLTGAPTEDGVSIQFSTGLESGDVAAYNVYRVAGDSRVQVNREPILPIGGESNVYQVVDGRTGRARVARGGIYRYVVETVYGDGSTTEAGPFEVQIGEERGARRSR